MVAAADLTGWLVGYVLGAAVVLAVAALLVLIIRAAHGIADVAEDATRLLAETQERTEVLWQLGTTNQVLTDLRDGAVQARTALGG
ncbi:MAG TPA: hypothetical protein VGM21_15530 [Actinomycetota bacterium]|jgi:hypothetical protein